MKEIFEQDRLTTACNGRRYAPPLHAEYVTLSKKKTMNWVLIEDEHNRGTADPYVARTILQASELCELFELGTEEKQGIVGVFQKYRRHLHQCDEISQRIIVQMNNYSDELKISAQPRDEEILRLPSVRNLTSDIETFLYHAKLAFRELKGLFQFTQGKKFSSTTRYNHVADWSKKEFGEDNRLSKWLRCNCDWTQKLIDSRNAIEHPENASLVIKNFHLTGKGTISKPTWALNDEKPKLILKDMGVIPENMLAFAEILLIYSLMNTKNIYPIVIAEIPEDKREIARPVRFIATLEQDLDEAGMYKYNRN